MPTEAKDVPQRNTAGFIVQGNPSRFNIDAYLASQPYVYWRWPQHREAVKLGMPVFIKRSGKGGGIVASGVIKELPAAPDMVAHQECRGESLWSETPESEVLITGIELNDIRLTPEEGMILTSEFQAIPELAGRPLVEAPHE